jgi:hypothetical protein
MNIEYLVLKFETDRPVEEDASKLRGYIGSIFEKDILLHHHIEGERYLFTYPKVQYKVLSGVPVVVGLSEGVSAVKNIIDGVNELKLGQNKYKVHRIMVDSCKSIFGKSRNMHGYNFVLPWICFNQQNYTRYRLIDDWKEKKNFINKILVGNILSMCKGLDYIVHGSLSTHTRIDAFPVRFKGIKLVGFYGSFRVNFHLPDLVGLGKGVSHGFGTVRKS